MGSAVDARRMDVPHRRHRDGLVLGLLRAWVGRFLVLGPRGKCFADAMAGRHGASAFSRRYGETQRPENLDAIARHTGFLAFARRYISRAIGCADIRAYFRQRSGAWRIHSRYSRRIYRWRPCTVRVARPPSQARRFVRADFT